jgi:hypothetical protein
VAAPPTRPTPSSGQYAPPPLPQQHQQQQQPQSQEAALQEQQQQQQQQHRRRAEGAPRPPPQQPQLAPSQRAARDRLRAALSALADPARPLALPPAAALQEAGLDNRELDKLMSAIGRNRSTWRRALVLFEWLKEAAHAMDDRLCTTVR